jgi:hypothetical protein
VGSGSPDTSVLLGSFSDLHVGTVAVAVEVDLAMGIWLGM